MLLLFISVSYTHLVQSDKYVDDNDKKEETVETKKPFLLSDLAHQYEDTQESSENAASCLLYTSRCV